MKLTKKMREELGRHIPAPISLAPAPWDPPRPERPPEMMPQAEFDTLRLLARDPEKWVPGIPRNVALSLSVRGRASRQPFNGKNHLRITEAGLLALAEAANSASLTQNQETTLERIAEAGPGGSVGSYSGTPRMVEDKVSSQIASALEAMGLVFRINVNRTVAGRYRITPDGLRRVEEISRRKSNVSLAG